MTSSERTPAFAAGDRVTVRNRSREANVVRFIGCTGWNVYEVRDDLGVRYEASEPAMTRVEVPTFAVGAPLPDACPKCGGSKYIAAFAHIDGGRCYACK